MTPSPESVNAELLGDPVQEFGDPAGGLWHQSSRLVALAALLAASSAAAAEADGASFFGYWFAGLSVGLGLLGLCVLSDLLGDLG